MPDETTDERTPSTSELIERVVRLRGLPGYAGEDIDLSGEIPERGLYVVRTQPARLANQDWMRGLIALILVVVSALVVLGSLTIVLIAPASVDSLLKILGVVLGFLGGLVGSATGFYFARTSRGS